MLAREDCTSSDHRAPADGGSCACGMVTRIPVARVPGSTDVRDVLARCLEEESAGARPSAVLQQRVERVLAALVDAGLVVAPDTRLRPPA
ncbi:hypothetical protein [Blastococcus sp. VKM Ac-2987]|uniref:hypothetical protein n=1 Tax=Blastococcus sp. VKM Ac-2987 TaxID=3004141 RepID=UPI0022AB8325|nr:hypothetical protein [Blastococcus sp. VKM Ac-2987]MCZ2858030.1 hypothetical protein [Blastococcus sp. VKM Ac-2987]